MELADCTSFANDHPVCYMATMDGDRPRVRALMLWFADERGFYFMTMSPKRLSAQLHRAPRVEVCFFNGAQELPDAKMMRVNGEVDFVDDVEMVGKVAQERAALCEIIGRPLEPIAEVFRIHSGEAHFWTLGDILKEQELERVRF